MRCDICFRTGGDKLPFLCPTDARNQLYEPRIQHAHVLLEKDALDQQITALLDSEPDSNEKPATSALIGSQSTRSRWEIDKEHAEADQAADRTQLIIAHADELRAKIGKARDEIARKKASIARRKSELASAVNGVEARRTRQKEEVEQAVRRTKYKWKQAHTITAASRVFLCGEAGRLYGLQRVRRNGELEEYRIGGIPIADLRSMNTAVPAQVTTALSHIVHLLMLTTHYLGIRLPAEITLPHRDYPLPTIFSLSSSYIHSNVPFPGSTPVPSSTNSPTASRHTEPVNQPRPRPLFITRPLPILANDDPAAYALFLEGVTLLAYNIAWVCKSQGIPIGVEGSGSIDDIFAIGRNFYNLLLTSPSRSVPSSRVPSSQSTPTKDGSRDTDVESEDARRGSPASIMGRYSHSTAYSFLGGADGTEFIRSWKLPSPIKLADRLKTRLMSEVANAEWEVLDQDAWAEDDELGDDGVVVGARNEAASSGRMAGMQSFMSMRTVVDAVEMIGGDGDRKSGTNGWTKLKPR